MKFTLPDGGPVSTGSPLVRGQRLDFNYYLFLSWLPWCKRSSMGSWVVLVSSVAHLCPTLCNPMDCHTLGFPIQQLLELAQTHVHWVSDAVQPFHPLFPSCLQSLPASGSYPMSQFFASGDQNIGPSASASVFPMNIQDWFPLGLMRLISLKSKGLSREFSNTTVQKHQFFIAQLSLWSNSHIYMWLLEKP